MGKSEPINLTETVIDKALKDLCGPSFVPTPVNVNWNDKQQGWLDFKRKVRWRTFFSLQLDKQPDRAVWTDLDAPYKKSAQDPPAARIPAIETFLNRVEHDLFTKTVYKNVPDNLSSDERKALNEFRSISGDEKDIVIRLQDKGNNFVFIDKRLERKVKEQIDRGSFGALTEGPTLETCLEISNWVKKWKPLGLSDKWIEYITSNNNCAHPGVNYPPYENA